ncbi:helix-turn-helix domain-containing protein [Pseudoflavonifractor sp. HCP28S3_F10]|uniref:helix-turn-helix domain-containing protein n=1 Tax=Pseudoflavonifractor sp. HCP28S3_F10 TaxID=3438947 RepID=UPI003F8A7313
MKIGEKIRFIRLEKGMTQKQVAERCGMADSAIRKYESGTQTPKIETLRRIAEALDVSIYELLSKEEKEVYDAGISDGQTAMEWVYHKLDGYSFTKAEHFLIGAFSKLNTDGQSVAVERVEELTEIPKYTKRFEALTPEEKHLAETGQWSKMIELQFGAHDPQTTVSDPDDRPTEDKK